MSETRKSNFYAYAATMRSARLTLNWERDRLRALEEGAPLPSPMGSVGMFVHGGGTADRTQSEVMRRMVVMDHLRESIAENAAKLKEFKTFITSAGLNDEANALVWARWGMGVGFRELGKLLGMDNRTAWSILLDAESELAAQWNAGSMDH